jgi:hypothetical protein
MDPGGVRLLTWVVGVVSPRRLAEPPGDLAGLVRAEELVDPAVATGRTRGSSSPTTGSAPGRVDRVRSSASRAGRGLSSFREGIPDRGQRRVLDPQAVKSPSVSAPPRRLLEVSEVWCGRDRRPRRSRPRRRATGPHPEALGWIPGPRGAVRPKMPIVPTGRVAGDVRGAGTRRTTRPTRPTPPGPARGVGRVLTVLAVTEANPIPPADAPGAGPGARGSAGADGRRG